MLNNYNIFNALYYIEILDGQLSASDTWENWLGFAQVRNILLLFSFKIMDYRLDGI